MKSITFKSCNACVTSCLIIPVAYINESIEIYEDKVNIDVFGLKVFPATAAAALKAAKIFVLVLANEVVAVAIAVVDVVIAAATPATLETETPFVVMSDEILLLVFCC